MSHRLFKVDVQRKLAVVESLPASVRDMVQFEMVKAVWGRLEHLQKCESPIEQMLFLPLARQVDGFNERHYKVTFPGLEEVGCFLTLKPQHRIKAGGRQYRADFLLEVTVLDGTADIPSVVVECDGHDYHERTKEQASRDKRRDREMQAAGYHVLRYSGSDIWHDPEGCARDVISFIENSIQKATHGGGSVGRMD